MKRLARIERIAAAFALRVPLWLMTVLLGIAGALAVSPEVARLQPVYEQHMRVPHWHGTLFFFFFKCVLIELTTALFARAGYLQGRHKARKDLGLEDDGSGLRETIFDPISALIFGTMIALAFGWFRVPDWAIFAVAGLVCLWAGLSLTRAAFRRIGLRASSPTNGIMFGILDVLGGVGAVFRRRLPNGQTVEGSRSKVRPRSVREYRDIYLAPRDTFQVTTGKGR